MNGYYFKLAVRSLRRNAVITALMVAAVGVGIGASMTVYTVLRAMSGNPIPEKSEQLYMPQIDVWGPPAQQAGVTQGGSYQLPAELTYLDAAALLRAQHAPRQAAMYAVSQDISPVGARAFRAGGRATSRDFFAMFDVPFRSGAAWDRAAEEKRENVVVLGARLADRVFPHTDPLGKVISLSDHDYRIVGVVDLWAPMPRFYDLEAGAFGDEQFFIPFSTAIDRHITSSGNENCPGVPTGGWDAHLNSDCVWLQFWAELPTAALASDYKVFLRNYAAEQQRSGRFHWPPRVELRNVTDLLVYERVVPAAFRAISLVADGFLVVCLVNAVGLLLAKFSSRATELALRRALGASQMAVFRQCITETLLIGLLGGLVGLALTAAGLAGLRALLDVAARQGFPVARLISLNVDMVVITLVVAVVVTVCAGLYPTWRASRVQPAWQLKAQ
jgi:putative ABC transport system permease protein